MASEETLEFTAAVVAQELWGGDWRSFPLGDPTLVAHGVSLEGCLAEQRAVLELYLAKAHPDVLSRFSLPPEATLREVLVPLSRLDLPERQRVTSNVAISAVVVPLTDAQWVLVSSLDHAFRLPLEIDQPLERIILEELRRVIAARDPSAVEFLQLLPPGLSQLERLTLQLRREHGRARGEEKRARERQARRDHSKLLASIGTPLHREVRVGHDLIGREAEFEQLRKLLRGKGRLSVALVGPELSGKSALFRRWLAEETIRAGDAGPMAFATSGSQLLAGMSGHGQWEERIHRVLHAAEQLDAILYFDSVDDLLAERDTGGIDVAGAMKQVLEEGRVRIVAELSPEALSLFEKRHSGFISNFARVHVKPLSSDKTLQILRRRTRHQAESNSEQAVLTQEAAQSLLDLTERYLPYRALPGAAVRFEEELRALHGADRNAANLIEPITPAKVFSAFSLRSGIPEFLLREDRSLHAAEVEAWFRDRLVGQRAAVSRVVETLCVVKANLQPQGKPLANLLFVGPTGVGKTELARLLATYLFGSPERLFRYDMSEYADPWAADRLIRGSARSEGTLTRQVRQQPFCVLLLDEIEKAHPAVFDLLLQLCGEGRLTDASGRTAYFHNAIVVLTSNLGAAHRRNVIGLGAQPEDDETYYDRQVEQTFRPEFVNRLDRVIPFHPLSREEIATVSKFSLRKVQLRRGFGDAGLELKVEDEVATKLTDEGYSPAYGARALRRHVEDTLVAPAARYISSSGGWPKGSVLRVAMAEGRITFTAKPASGPATRSNKADVQELQRRRASVTALMALDRIKQIRERIAFLTSQLSLSDPRSRATIDGQIIGSWQEERHRLDERWSPAERAFEQLQESEEEAILGFQAALDIREHHTRGLEAYRAFIANLPYLLLAEERRRNDVTLLLSEQEHSQSLDLWLGGLYRVADSRQWVVTTHFDNDEGATRHQRWGPPRPLLVASQILRSPGRFFRNAMVTVRGPYAGVFLALEAGLHRFTGLKTKSDPAHLSIQLVGMKPLSDKDLASPALQPKVLAWNQLSSMTSDRLWDGRAGVVRLERAGRSVDMNPDGYWVRFDEIVLQQLLAYEEEGSDRDAAFLGLLERVKERAS